MLSWVTRTHISSARANLLRDMGEIMGLGKTYQDILSRDSGTVKNFRLGEGPKARKGRNQGR